MTDLKLRRVPALPQKDLTPMQAADEILIQQFFDSDFSENTQVLIIEDHFGGITTSLIQKEVHVKRVKALCDSRCSQEALEGNLYRNQLPKPKIVSSLGQIWEHLDTRKPIVVLMRWTKAIHTWKHLTSLLFEKLCEFQSKVHFLSSGMLKHYSYQYRDILGSYGLETDLSRITKKARILSASFPKDRTEVLKKIQELKRVQNSQGDILFNQGKVDQASQLLIESIEKLSIGFPTSTPESKQLKIADLGAGSGALGFAAFLHFGGTVDFIEDSALSCEQLNTSIQQHSSSSSFRLYQGNLFEDEALENSQYDLIVSNPPYHQYHTLTPSLVTWFIKDALDHLSPKGQLLWVTSDKINPPHFLNGKGYVVESLALAKGHQVWSLKKA